MLLPDPQINKRAYADDKARELHGGYGYMCDFLVERMVCDAKMTEICEVTDEIQGLVIGVAITR